MEEAKLVQKDITEEPPLPGSIFFPLIFIGRQVFLASLLVP
jgi:hypothetical protein